MIGRTKLNEPGAVFKYNDVRVNLLAYSLLQVVRKPLPVVLKENIMDKIGASTTWRWYGYENSFVNVDGVMMQSVSGGGHFGGGLFISAVDHARFGLLMLRKGKWKGEQLISQTWIKMATQPSKSNKQYGFLWWLNTTDQYKGLPENIFLADGFGGNFIVMDTEHDLVMVLRWLEPSKLGAFMKLVIDSIEK
jgi:CubicO group peptidase (beta-lactamase class C family)